MFRFTLFRIPVTVEPWFWALTFLLGGGLTIRDRDGLIFTLGWMGVCFISILVHELGHALSGRWMAGGRQAIRLWAFGGLAYSQGGRWTTRKRVLMTLAGPGAGFLLFGAIVAGIMIAFPGKTGLEIIVSLFLGNGPAAGSEAHQFIYSLEELKYQKKQLPLLLGHFLYINFWWGLLNLLPIHPLDGGQIAVELLPARRRAHQVGLIVGIGVAILFLLSRSFYPAVLFGYLAWQNHIAMKTHSF